MRTDERRWLLLKAFYRGYRSFHALLAQYEGRVEFFAQKYGVDRKELSLPPDELLSLFDSHALLELRDGDLKMLREISHQLLRGDAPDPFDSYVTNIYHEVSILKEEEWTLREQAAGEDAREYERYYREVNIYYPKRLKHVRNLYGKARKRLEAILPSLGTNTIVVRSIYLFGKDLFQGVYKGGLDQFYSHLYPEGGALEGYTVVANSFLEGGFGPEAAAAFERAIEVAAREEARAESEGGAASQAQSFEEERRALEKRREKALALA